jgi:hypothetical protein
MEKSKRKEIMSLSNYTDIYDFYINLTFINYDNIVLYMIDNLDKLFYSWSYIKNVSHMWMFDLLGKGLSVLCMRLRKKAVAFETSWCVVCFKTTEKVLLFTSDVKNFYLSRDFVPTRKMCVHREI